MRAEGIVLMNQELSDLGEYIAKYLSKDLIAFILIRDELIITVKREAILRVMTFLKNDAKCLAKILVDICGVDFPEKEQRFEVVYNLLSPKHNNRIRVKVLAKEGAQVPSVVSIFPSAGWFERECWDLYGIYFSDHPDLRRILTDYGFNGHPLRKDFPLTGFVELKYDDEQSRIVQKPVHLNQEFRSFDFLSPWEGIQHELPDEDKGNEEGD